MARAATCVLVVSVTLWSLQVSASLPQNVREDKKGVCKRYGITCPVEKMCMLQEIKWPLKMEIPICVKEKFVPAHVKACLQPPDRGPCAAEFIRWHYNAQADQCSWFYYGGCRGNRNKFFTKRVCEKTCIGDRPSSTPEKNVLTRGVIFDRRQEIPDLLDLESDRRAREFKLRPTPTFQELRSKIETTVRRHPPNGSRKRTSKREKNEKKHERDRKNRHHRRLNNSHGMRNNRHDRQGDNQWPNAYRKSMRRGELFKLFSVLNHQDKDHQKIDKIVVQP